MAADAGIVALDAQAVESPTAVVDSSPAAGFQIDPNGERISGKGQATRNPETVATIDLLIANDGNHFLNGNHMGNRVLGEGPILGDVII